MIDAGPSLKAAEGLDASTVAGYLVARGWAAAPTRIKGVFAYSKTFPDSNEPVQLVLPNRSGFSDENRRVADALRALAQIEGRSEAAIADDVRHANILGSRGVEVGEILQELTPREREVVALLIRGESSSQIALSLSLPEATIKRHVAKVTRKFGASGGTFVFEQMIALLHGLIDQEIVKGPK